MSCGPEFCAFQQCLLMWIAGDFEGLMALFDENIVWNVNIDGIAVPYASSAVGKEDLRWRLEHMMDTFNTDGFEIGEIVHGAETCHSLVHVYYVHRRTGEPLDVNVRFTGWQRDGLLVRFEECADAAYVEAYTRFVNYLESTNRGRRLT